MPWKGKHSSFPYPLTPTKPAFTVWLNFLFVYYIKYCFVPFTAAPLICGLAFRYQVSAVSFAWLCGGDWVYCPPYFNQSANVLIALTVSKGISQVNVVYHCGNSDQMALPSMDFLNPLPYAYLCWLFWEQSILFYAKWGSRYYQLPQISIRIYGPIRESIDIPI